MRKSILLIVFIAAICVTGMAQSYQAAGGFRLGPSSGLTGKFFLDKTSAVEVILGTRWGGGQVVVLYEIHNKIFSSRSTSHGFDTDRLLWYFGAGGHLGSYSSKNVPSYWDWDQSSTSSQLIIGVDGIIGVEYTLPSTPINFSLDLKPAFNLVGHSGFWGDQGAVSIRYAF